MASGHTTGIVLVRFLVVWVTRHLSDASLDTPSRMVLEVYKHYYRMYTVIKRMEISASHSLRLSYPSKCENLHGHNWMITVYCRSKELNADGMVVDFSHIKRSVKSLLDHQNLNDILPFNPTAENIAFWVYEQIPSCFKVEVKESEGNTAIYEED